jgi:hypothetical protein
MRIFRQHGRVAYARRWKTGCSMKVGIKADFAVFEEDLTDIFTYLIILIKKSTWNRADDSFMQL